MVWPWEARTSKNGECSWTKVPRQACNPRRYAKSDDPNTWGEYGVAVTAVQRGDADGIGFMLKDSEVGAVDLDHVRDAATGELIDWAKDLCVEAEGLGLYREITVSGGGLRFIGSAQGTNYIVGSRLMRMALASSSIARRSGLSLSLDCKRALARSYRRSMSISMRY